MASSCEGENDVTRICVRAAQKRKKQTFDFSITCVNFFLFSFFLKRQHFHNKTKFRKFIFNIKMIILHSFMYEHSFFKIQRKEFKGFSHRICLPRPKGIVPHSLNVRYWE